LEYLGVSLVYELMMRSDAVGPEKTLEERIRMERLVHAFLKTKEVELDLARANPPVDLDVLCKRLMPDLAALAGVPVNPPPLWHNQP